jgi:hypothetical protein
MASSTGGAVASTATVGSLLDVTASTVSSFLDMASGTVGSAGDTTFRDQGMSSSAMERLTSTVSYASTEGTETSWDNGTTSGGIFTTDWGGGEDGFCRYCKVNISKFSAKRKSHIKSLVFTCCPY